MVTWQTNGTDEQIGKMSILV